MGLSPQHVARPGRIEPVWLPLVLMAFASALSSLPAHAQDAEGESLDIELVPFATNATTGLPEGGVAHGEAGATTLVLLSQVSRGPLSRLTGPAGELSSVEFEEVIPYRVQVSFGVETMLAETLAVRLAVPMIVDAARDSNGIYWEAGAGDPALYASWSFIDGERFSWAALTGVRLPFGSLERWMGESKARFYLGLPFEVRGGAGSFQSSVGIDVAPDPTTLDWAQAFGDSLSVDSLLRVKVRPRVYALLGEQMRVLLRGPIGTRAALEGRVGLEVEIGDHLSASVGAATAFFRGYGASSPRGWLSVRVHLGAPDLTEDEEPEPLPVPPRPQVPTAEEDPPDPIAEAIDSDGSVRFGQAIRFEQGSAALIPSSERAITELAAWMKANPRIDLVLLEGHASAEGSFEYNEALALRRAQTVFRGLLLRGIPPTRLAVRSAGEVQPPASDDEARRQVRVQVMRVLHELDPDPDHPTRYVLPWSGEVYDTEAR